MQVRGRELAAGYPAATGFLTHQSVHALFHSAGSSGEGPRLQPSTCSRPSLDGDPQLAMAVQQSEALLGAPVVVAPLALHAVDLTETHVLAAGADALVRLYSYEDA